MTETLARIYLAMQIAGMAMTVIVPAGLIAFAAFMTIRYGEPK